MTFPGTPSSTTLTASSSGTPFNQSKPASASQSAPAHFPDDVTPTGSSVKVKDAEKPLAQSATEVPLPTFAVENVKSTTDGAASGDYKAEVPKRRERTKHKARKSLKVRHRNFALRIILSLLIFCLFFPHSDVVTCFNKRSRSLEASRRPAAHQRRPTGASDISASIVN